MNNDDIIESGADGYYLERQIIRDAAETHFREGGDKVKFKSGDDANAAYDTVRGPLTVYAYNRVGKDWMDAEDCVQDAYVKIFETAKVNEFFNFGGLYKIWLDRAIRDKKRENRRQGEVLIEEENNEGLSYIDLAESNEAQPDLLMETQARVDDLMEFSNTLKPKKKAMVRLFFIYGYTLKEIAEMLNVTKKRVENSLAYFRIQFAEKYK